MPSKAIEWSSRLKSVEREYLAAYLAATRLEKQCQSEPHLLRDQGLKREDVRMLMNKLEGTYHLRLFAEFEQALRYYLRACKIRVPRNAEPLIDRVRTRAKITHEITSKVHAVRDYRNTMIHDESLGANPVTMRNATSSLATFLYCLKDEW
jgi:hypothetical protein